VRRTLPELPQARNSGAAPVNEIATEFE